MKTKPVILYIDDEEENLIGFKAIFSKTYEVLVADNTSDAVEILKSRSVNLMLVDFRLNDTDGISFIKQVKNKYPKIIYIVVTAYAEVEYVIDAINMQSIFGFVQKPWEYNSLKIMLSNGIESQKVKEENERLLEEIKQSKKESLLRHNFFANMSHEIRTPMTGILGLVDLVLETELDGTQNEYLETIKSSSESLLKILDDILLISKMKSNKLVLIPQPTNVSTFVNEIRMLFHSAFQKKELDLKINISKDIPQNILVDKNRLKQIITNLISNAIKFTDAGFVELNLIFLGQDPDKVKIRIEVADTGIGIEKDKIESIFESFSQVNSAYARNSTGTGLGLAICKNLVSQMGGQIGAVSEIGKGSLFFMELEFQVSESSNEEKVEILGMTEPLNLNILVAEDVPTNQKIIELILQSFSCNVTIANNGAEAVDLVKGNKFDLIVMDVQMPVMSGIEATHKIKKELGVDIPIIGLSANSMDGDAEKYINEGLDDYITKPIIRTVLYQKLYEWKKRIIGKEL